MEEYTADPSGGKEKPWSLKVGLEKEIVLCKSAFSTDCLSFSQGKLKQVLWNKQYFSSTQILEDFNLLKSFGAQLLCVGLESN